MAVVIKEKRSLGCVLLLLLKQRALVDVFVLMLDQIGFTFFWCLWFVFNPEDYPLAFMFILDRLLVNYWCWMLFSAEPRIPPTSSIHYSKRYLRRHRYLNRLSSANSMRAMRWLKLAKRSRKRMLRQGMSHNHVLRQGTSHCRSSISFVDDRMVASPVDLFTVIISGCEVLSRGSSRCIGVAIMTTKKF